MLGWLTVLLVLLVALFYFLTGEGSSVSDVTGVERWMLIGSAAIIALYALQLLAGSGSRMSQNARHLMIWAGLIVVLIAGYSYRGEFSDLGNRVMSELTPPGHSLHVGDANGEVAVRLRKHPNGHFVARSKVNGTQMTLLVDTGASSVVLKPADAERAGIDVSGLSFSTPVQTANGMTFTAPVRLRSIAIGDIVLHDVQALVAKPGSLNENLLGMSFLTRLRSYEFSGDFLTLRG
ncbi:MAG: TIGR02281 family clan AA aspartic protease [Alphaproteobacteria bacterium]|nr:TIGR02281 family clan AA aspartic protease [Alphaproteobacteria bacterium]